MIKTKILKLFVINISVYFVFLSLNASGTIVIKPVGILDETITINPPEPNGNFEWYITPVNVTFHAQDDIQLAYIYYKVTTEGQTDPNWTQVDIRDKHTAKFNKTITINFDGVHTANFYAEDHVGNIGPIHTSTWIKIDITAPEVSLSKEKISFNEIIFTADVTDSASGIHTVKFYVDNETEPRNEDTTVPYLFIWNGLGNHTITAEACDYAGNKATTEMYTTKSCDFLLKTILLQALLHKS